MNDNKIIINDGKTVSNSCSSVNSKVQPLIEEADIIPNTIECGPLVIKVPVVLAEVKVKLPIEATITLDKEVLEINRIRKNVYLTQSRIIPFSEDNCGDNGILFVEGLIKKSIEYVPKTYNAEGVPNNCGYIRYSSFNVPFNFTTRINFIREPIFMGNSIPCEIEFFTNKIKGCDECSDTIVGSNPCDESSAFTEVFNEKPFTEIVKAEIIEVDINTNAPYNCTSNREKTFTKVTEKIILNLTLKILQKQQVRITAE
ncbi:MAG: hypothetical protein HUJ77_00150 [Clostridium sp.]|uniref:CsxC family protein n=1 Tax=Clostridium sp. TaxID=1506 RepID=UPI0025BB9B93|nr:hypothetical protein [Clostridium sp.]MCF0146785.1 hypothetical protein [Clostridium sp.]